jgi:hypothetical protein
MNRLACFILGLLLMSCGGGSPPNNATPYNPATDGTGSAYYPLIPGTFIAYDTYTITGTYDNVTGIIGNVVATGPTAINPVSTSKQWALAFSLQSCAVFGSKPFFAQTYVPGINPPTNYYDLLEAVADATFDVPGLPEYIGEGFGSYGTLSPGEPLITTHPIVGEKFDVTSVSTSSCNSTVPVWSGVSTYTTIGTVDPIDGTKGVIYTGLFEHRWNNAFNYVYSPGIGNIRTWTIAVGADGHGSGVMYVRRK